jgi:tripartite-type tricarboxylate transporter receptor subunit TctC
MLGLGLILGGYQGQAQAQGAADFFKGKTITINTGDKPGGGSDLTARLVGQYLSKQLGATVVTMNKTGAAHMEGYHFVWNAKPDGLTFGCEDFPSLVTNDLQEMPGVQYQAEKYSYVGGIGDEEVIFWVSAKGPIKSIQDLKAGRGLKLVATSITGRRATDQVMVAYLLDLDAKVIAGLKGSKECDLAVMQGEATGTTSSALSYRQGVKAGTHKGLFTLDVRRNEGIPDVPALTELVKLPKEKLELLELMLTLRTGKALYSTPGIPKDRLDFLRNIFKEIWKQPNSKADLEKLWYPRVLIVDGEELANRAIKAKANKKEWRDQFKVLFDKYRG